MSTPNASRSALRELIDLLEEVDRRWSSEEWNLFSEEDIAGSHRALIHILEAALVGYFEFDEGNPDFRRIVTPSRKLTGDNSDAIYFDAPVHPANSYRVTGELKGADYFSLTLEAGAREGKLASSTVGVLNDREIDVDAEGRFEVYLGGEARERNWLPLGEDASRVTTRHYFEHEQPAAANPDYEPRMQITCLHSEAAEEPALEEQVALGIRRVGNVVRSRTLDMPPMANREQPPFVSLTPNEFPPPIPPGSFGLAAFDAHYSMAPYFLGTDEALVIRGRWPDCRFANVCLWNRFQQTFDYSRHSVSLNRKQTHLEADGSFVMVLAHEDPGHPNWLNTEGKPFGLVFWRYFLAEGEVATPQAEVIQLADLDYN